MNGIRTVLIAALADAGGSGIDAGQHGAGPVEDATGDGPNVNADAGPPSDLPGPVPEFVGDLLDTIRGSASGAAGGLGDAVSDLAGGSPGGACGD